MLQKIELKELHNLSLAEVKSYKEKVVARKSELEAAKAKGGKAWTANLQDELNELALLIVDIDEIIEQKPTEEENTVKKYVPAPGTENMVHISIIRGRRYDPKTGKEISKPFVQLFTFSEWKLFKENYARLGYAVIDALHDPYNDAKDLVEKE